MSLRVEVGRLLRRPGQHRSVEGTETVPELRLGDAGVRGDAVGLALDVEGAAGDEIVVTGRIRATWDAVCRRCLEPLEVELDLEVREIFERNPVEGETYPLGDDDWIDLEPVVREAVLPAAPVAPLCAEDCAGPEPDRFPTGDAETAPDEPVRDPRWAPLDELRLE